MVSQHMLSKPQFAYITSQKGFKVKNPSEERKRVVSKVKKMFKTMKIILDSKTLGQDFKDNMFNPREVRVLIDSLTQHDPDNPKSEEVNKQAITLYMIEQVLAYYRSRYQDDKIVIKRIEEFKTLAQDLHERAKMEKEETEASMMYKIRGKMPTPPLIQKSKYDHTALCIWCHAYSVLGKTKEDAINRIRHAKYCSFHIEWKRLGKIDKERVITQFFETQKPIKKS
ncbi:MAG: hypothetical protein IIA83_11525 [Thaumarchaeota archaeon]|nr:hypothetical protein [Nitrososphaerota archaeon]